MRRYHAVNKVYLKTVWLDGFIGSLKAFTVQSKNPMACDSAVFVGRYLVKEHLPLHEQQSLAGSKCTAASAETWS